LFFLVQTSHCCIYSYPRSQLFNFTWVGLRHDMLPNRNEDWVYYYWRMANLSKCVCTSYHENNLFRYNIHIILEITLALPCSEDVMVNVIILSMFSIATNSRDNIRSDKLRRHNLLTEHHSGLALLMHVNRCRLKTNLSIIWFLCVKNECVRKLFSDLLWVTKQEYCCEFLAFIHI